MKKNIILPSLADLIDIFFVSITFIHTWNWIWFFFNTESLLNQYSFIEFVSIFSYLQLFCLIETLIVFSIATGITILLQLISSNIHFLSQAMIILFFSSIWLMLINLVYIYESFTMNIWLISFLIVLILISVINACSPPIEQAFSNIARRFFGLGIFFIFVDLISLVIVGLRNI
jgi:hypothetical protein